MGRTEDANHNYGGNENGRSSHMSNREASGGGRDMFDNGRIPLELLDPGHSDPGHWARFQARVMALAGPALARRRVARQPTVGEVLASWWRLLVPASVVAGAAMVSLLMPAETAPGTDIAIDEALLAGFDDEPLPDVLVADQVDEVAFLVAIEGG